jgi:hypothetical protein
MLTYTSILSYFLLLNILLLLIQNHAKNAPPPKKKKVVINHEILHNIVWDKLDSDIGDNYIYILLDNYYIYFIGERGDIIMKTCSAEAVFMNNA